MNTKIGEAVKQFRMERDWTLDRLAAVIGVHRSTIRLIEQSKVFPNDRTLYKLKKFIPAVEAACKAEQPPKPQDQPAA